MGATTRVFGPSGKPWGYVTTSSSGGWYVGRSSECGIDKIGRSFELTIGHTIVGAAVPFSPVKYNVWATPSYESYFPSVKSLWLRGSVVRRSVTRWDFFSRRSRFVGFAIGRDGPAAGVAEVLIGGNLLNPPSCR
jgi:hypothetical protein